MAISGITNKELPWHGLHRASTRFAIPSEIAYERIGMAKEDLQEAEY